MLSIFSYVYLLSYIFFEEVSVQIFCLFFGLLVGFLIVQFYEFFVYFRYKPLSDVCFANIFSQSVGCLFVLFMVSFAVQELLSLIRSHLFIFITLGGGSKKILL